MAESSVVAADIAEDVTAGLVSASKSQQVQEPGRVSVWNDIPLRVYKWTPSGDIR